MPRANSRPSPPAASDPPSIFERLWQETGCQRVIEQLLDGRRFEFDVERAVFLTVLHRLFAPGSDRAADKWKADYQIDGCESLQLHHLYRAMAWLGEELPEDQQKDKTPFAPRCTKDRIEEEVFAHRRDLFTDLQLVFFDTTSIYFEGEGARTSASGATARTIGPTCTRWSWVRCSTARAGRSVVSCGPATPPT